MQGLSVVPRSVKALRPCIGDDPRRANQQSDLLLLLGEEFASLGATLRADFQAYRNLPYLIIASLKLRTVINISLLFQRNALRGSFALRADSDDRCTGLLHKCCHDLVTP